LQRVVFNVAMATVRGNLSKVQMELKSKNVGTAKTEIDSLPGPLVSAFMSLRDRTTESNLGRVERCRILSRRRIDGQGRRSIGVVTRSLGCRSFRWLSHQFL
jgi:hypothetical protein